MANIYKQALDIYYQCIDMDYIDYEETLEKDLAHIVTLIMKQGYDATLVQLLAEQ